MNKFRNSSVLNLFYFDSNETFFAIIKISFSLVIRKNFYNYSESQKEN